MEVAQEDSALGTEESDMTLLIALSCTPAPSSDRPVLREEDSSASSAGPVDTDTGEAVDTGCFDSDPDGTVRSVRVRGDDTERAMADEAAAKTLQTLAASLLLCGFVAEGAAALGSALEAFS